MYRCIGACGLTDASIVRCMHVATNVHSNGDGSPVMYTKP